MRTAISRTAVAAGLLAALASVAAGQAGPAATTTTLAPADIKETTEVLGPVPDDLVGRWLFVAQIKLPSGQVRPYARLLEFRRGPERLEIALRRGAPPAAIAKKTDQAGAAGQAWMPEPADLQAAAAGWDEPVETVGDVRTIEHKLYAASAFTPELNSDEVTKGCELALITSEAFSGATPAKSGYAVYGIRERSADQMSGAFVTVTLAAAPFPIPITLKGDFQAHRLSGTGSRSWFQRLFSGCGRN